MVGKRMQEFSLSLPLKGRSELRGLISPLKTKDLFNSPFGELHAYRVGMLAQITASETGTLVLLGGSLLAASMILRWGLAAVVRAFSRNPKINLRAQETPSK
jgi:hypothetical protein